jgi:hypothetical protein
VNLEFAFGILLWTKTGCSVAENNAMHYYTKETTYIVSATSWLKAIPLQLNDIGHPIVRSQSRLVFPTMRDIMWTEM